MLQPRIVRHADDVHRWEMAILAPPPSLRPFVRRICGYDEASRTPLRRRELPSSSIALLLEFGPPVWIEDRTRDGAPFYRHGNGFIAGLDDRPSLTESAGAQRGIQLDLTPLGAYRLLRVRMADLAYRTTGFDDLLGVDGLALRQRLGDTAGWTARFDLLLAWLTPRVLGAPPPPREVDHAWAQLVAAGGQVEIGVLAQDVGWSRKHLAARFHETIGLAPKQVARLLRFERALALLRRDEMAAAEVALCCGYHDQAHMLRDFRSFAGGPPRDLLGRMLPDEGGLAG
jgi:AraC-like DNA-binding protein